jgi:hypothetical protein
MKTYLIQDGKNYKIGQSENPEKRFNQLKIGNLNVKMICFGDGISEAELHHKFKRKNISGEWFKLNKNDVEYIIRAINNEFSGLQPSSKSPGSYILTFGKYKGMMLRDINRDFGANYIKWIANKLNCEASNMAYKYLKSINDTSGIRKKKRNHRRFNSNISKAIIEHKKMDKEFYKELKNPYS